MIDLGSVTNTHTWSPERYLEWSLNRSAPLGVGSFPPNKNLIVKHTNWWDDLISFMSMRFIYYHVYSIDEIVDRNNTKELSWIFCKLSVISWYFIIRIGLLFGRGIVFLPHEAVLCFLLHLCWGINLGSAWGTHIQCQGTKSGQLSTR